jgi:hypothetical protein
VNEPQCGQQRPSCAQCLKAGLECGGYARARVWVNTYTPADAFAGAAVYSNPRPKATPALEEAVAAADVTLHPALARSAREDLYLGHYWAAYHPSLCYGGASSCFSTSGWTGVVRSLYNSESALRYAMFALSLSTVAVQHGDAHLRVRGLQAYATAVQKLGCAFAQPGRLMGDGMLAAIRLMAFYEIVFGARSGAADPGAPQIKGWHGHLKGEQSMLRLRGPAGFTTGAAHKLFVNGRLQIIMAGVSDRRRILLDAPEWKTIPWREQEKTPKDKVLDILASVPGHFEDLDALRTCADPEEAAALRAQLQADCVKAHEQLEAWEREIGPSIREYDYAAAAGALPEPESVADLELLHVSHLYWMTCATIYSTMHFCDNLPPGKDPREYAYKIAHAVHLFSAPRHGLSGFHAALIPLGVALRILRLVDPGSERRQQALLVDYLGRPDMGGYAGRFMPNIQRFLDSNDTQQVAEEQS